MSDNLDIAYPKDNNILGHKENTIQQFLTFTVGGEEYGVDIMSVVEIKGWSSITRLPNVPNFIRGVMNLRGLIIPIFDLRAKFNGGLTNATASHVVIILAVNNRNIGVLVDTVSDILNTNSNQIKPAPLEDMQIEEKYVTGLISLENRTVVLIDIKSLFTHQQIESVISK